MPNPPSSAVDKALDLVEVIARSDRPLRLSQLAGELGLHRATVYRVLLDLIRRGWVLRAGDHYLPGTVVLQLSQLAARNSLVTLCRPVLASLAAHTDMMINLQVLEADRSRVVDVVRPARLEMISHLRDELLAVHRFAGPLALVAMLDKDARGPYLRIAQDAAYPMTGDDGLLADIDRAADSGYAMERGRNEKLIASVSRAVLSAKGAPICALTIVGLDADFDESHLSELKSELRAATDELQQILTSLARAGA